MPSPFQNLVNFVQGFEERDKAEAKALQQSEAFAGIIGQTLQRQPRQQLENIGIAEQLREQLGPGNIALGPEGQLNVEGGAPEALRQNTVLPGFDLGGFSPTSATPETFATTPGPLETARQKAERLIKGNEKVIDFLGELDPELQINALKVLAADDKALSQDAINQVDELGKLSINILDNQDDPTKVTEIIRQDADLVAAQGGDLSKHLEFIKKSPDEQIAFANSLQAKARAFKDVLKTSTRGPAEPLTDLAKINADERRGLITPEQAEEGRAKLRGIPKPLTIIGKAKADLKAGLINQKDFNIINSAPPDFKSKVGKLIGDKNAAVNIFGADSPQVKAIQEAINSEAKGEGPKLSDEKGLRGDYIGLSGDFIKLGDNFKKINAARSTPAGDVSLIFNFMKMLDPTSVVREGEQATAASAGEIPDRVWNLYNRVILGEKLSPKQRLDFKAEGQNIFASQMGAQLRREKEFTGIATRAGMNPKNIVLDFIGPFRKVGGTTKIGDISASESGDQQTKVRVKF